MIRQKRSSSPRKSQMHGIAARLCCSFSVETRVGSLAMGGSRSYIWTSVCGFVLILSSICTTSLLHARPSSVRVISQSELVFGTFMLFGSGARIVSPSGTVSDQSIVALEGTIPRPARFNVQFDRGNESRRALDVEIELFISAPTQVRQDGVDARLSRFATDLPGYARVSPGEAMVIKIENCRVRVCSRSFSLGARLDVTRNYGGANLTVPINLDARIISKERP
ncbi:DUF4402 domain-containing protein [Erythrobacter rubeus]|uniref:DUF4402 domain-containing protein n=1 Tax=Erythrobacter rubeus TaxID=2760803 RepID=A0ABR8KT24_9SPHN|nr:DUF4402 domain-containing protein [Erythrobacter rubeus]MBD2843119.1 DUF4402 domain-containing protein [Erythrobacter rubeus]